MALEAPSNCWTNAVQVVADSLPQCAGFRSLAGAADATAAAAYVHQRKLSNHTREEVYQLFDVEGAGSYAIVFSPTGNPYNLVRGRSGTWEPNGLVIVAIQRAIFPTDVDRFASIEDEEDRYFENRVGDIMKQLYEYTDEEKTLRIISIAAVDATSRVRPAQRESQGNLQRATLVISWAFQGP